MKEREEIINQWNLINSNLITKLNEVGKNKLKQSDREYLVKLNSKLEILDWVLR